MVYEWKIKGKYKVSAEDAAMELERIRAKHDGVLNPADVAEESRDESAVLHNEFEWDDAKAADAYRYYQARHIIANVVVVQEPEADMENPRPPIRAYVSVENRKFEPIKNVLVVEDKRNALLERAKDEMRWFMVKYETLTELAGVFDAIREVI